MHFKWKMNFNRDPNKQGQKVIFRRKSHNTNHKPLTFHNSLVQQNSSEKYPCIRLDYVSNFQNHLKVILIRQIFQQVFHGNFRTSQLSQVLLITI